MQNVIDKLELMFAGMGAFLGWFFGGFDGFFYALVVFVTCDYFTGVLAAAVRHELSSEVGFKGIAKKVCICRMEKSAVPDSSASPTRTWHLAIRMSGVCRQQVRTAVNIWRSTLLHSRSGVVRGKPEYGKGKNPRLELLTRRNTAAANWGG